MPSTPTAYPLTGGVVVNPDGTVTVDELVNDPSRITRDVADLTMQRFYMDRVFTPAGGVEGGALLFERPDSLANDLFGQREPKEVSPAGEFPMQEFAAGIPMVARPRKIGNKWFITREAVKRNRPTSLRRNIIRTVNTIRRRVELMGLAELSAVVTAETRFRVGTSWGTYAGVTQANRTFTSGPVADIMAAMGQADAEEHGVEFDSLILHTNEAMKAKQAFPGMSLREIFGQAQDADDGGGQSIRNIFVTNRHAAGVATLFESGRVGEWRNEFPLEEETEWEGVAAGGRQRWWYQWSISPLFAVDDQFAILEVRGIA